MNTVDDDDPRLTAQLAELRAALRGVRAPDDEAKLLAAATLRRGATEAQRSGAHAQRFAAPVRAPRWRAPLAAAAGIAVAAMAVVLGLSHERADGGRGAAPLGAADEVERPSGGASAPELAFQPLAYAPGLSPSASYSVVRVRIPLEALAPGPATGSGRAIEADLLVGEDGLARGIRFDSADTLFVSTVSR